MVIFTRYVFGKIILFFVLLVGLVGVVYLDVYSHEDAHRIIGRNYGCIEDTITVNLDHGYWVCENYVVGRYDWEIRDEFFLHHMNEVYRYNTRGFFYLFIFFILIFVYYNERRGG